MINRILILIGITLCTNFNMNAQDVLESFDKQEVVGVEEVVSNEQTEQVVIDTAYNEDSIMKNTFVEYFFNRDSIKLIAIHDSSLYKDGWDSLPQPLFWKEVMKLPPDTAVVSIAANRVILEGIYSAFYDSLEKKEKIAFKDSLVKKHNLKTGTKLYVTFGRSDFYKVEEVVSQIDSAIKIFSKQKVDPFYAQAILLIESPNRLEYSWAGAYGPFQLMKSIGVKYGLKINKQLDERADLQKAAVTTAKYFKEFCIPQVKGILKQKNIAFDEHDLWFRLLVLHVYHAGWGNVKGVLNTISPKSGGQELITEIWQTTYGSFKNASQNYSQVALAAMMQLDELILYSRKLNP